MREVMELRLKLTGVLPFILRVRPNAVPSRRPIFQTGVAYFRIRPRAVRDRDPPTEKSEDWGDARRAHIQSSAVSLHGCQPERAENASRLAHPGMGCRTRGLRWGRPGVYTSFPLGGARLAGRCIVSI